MVLDFLIEFVKFLSFVLLIEGILQMLNVQKGRMKKEVQKEWMKKKEWMKMKKEIKMKKKEIKMKMKKKLMKMNMKKKEMKLINININGDVRGFEIQIRVKKDLEEGDQRLWESAEDFAEIVDAEKEEAWYGLRWGKNEQNI